MNTLNVQVTNQGNVQAHLFPAVSMILPFNPKMSSRKNIMSTLRIALTEIEDKLHSQFPEEMSTLVLQKLQCMIGKLDFSTHSLSIAIFISPVFEKLLYLDFPVENRIITGHSFDIRDLVYSKKDTHEYLALELGREECRLYMGAPNSLVRILANTPHNAGIYHSFTSSEAGDWFLKPLDKRTENYLDYNDKILDIILAAYPLPLFVLGNATITSYFKGLTKHAASVISYAEEDYENADEELLSNTLQPLVADWGKVKEKRILNQLERAARSQQVTGGLNNVWQQAINRGGRLLVFEKDYPYDNEDKSTNKIIDDAINPYNSFSCIKGQLDEAINRVLENRGDVEFVDKDVLASYDHVALVK
jgi:hypothetical protein